MVQQTQRIESYFRHLFSQKEDFNNLYITIVCTLYFIKLLRTEPTLNQHKSVFCGVVGGYNNRWHRATSTVRSLQSTYTYIVTYQNLHFLQVQQQYFQFEDINSLCHSNEMFRKQEIRIQKQNASKDHIDVLFDNMCSHQEF